MRPGTFDKGHRGPVRAGVALQESLNIPAVADSVGSGGGRIPAAPGRTLACS